MKQTKFSIRHLSFLVMAFAMVATLAIPLTTAFAAQVTNRSVELSSSSVSATGVQYNVKFTTGDNPAAAMVVYFCNNSPLRGQVCTAPTDFSAASATVTTAGFTRGDASANRVEVLGSFTANTEIDVTLGNITNPSVPTTTAPLFARVVTYQSAGDVEGTGAEASQLGTGVVDDGAMAIAITPTIGVTGVVLETLTFCVSGGTEADPEVSPIGDGCTGTLTGPTLQLGVNIGGVISLQPGVISSGSIYTQISTNASKGAVVRLKSSATGCGGMLRAGAEPGTCDIAPAQQTDIVEGDAKFGVRTSTATDGTGANGEYRPYQEGVNPAYYSNTSYAMRYVDDTDGVTSPFGDPFLDTAGAPANNKNMALTFAAAASNNTPAGSYSADISLIAVGKF